MPKPKDTSRASCAARAKPSAENIIFSRGWVGRRDLVWVLGEDEPSVGNQTKVMQLKARKWVHRIVPWGAVSVTASVSPHVDVIAVGADGQVLRGQPSGFSDEHVDPSTKGPEGLGNIRDARFIANSGKVVAVGMSRQVYVRQSSNSWIHLDAEIIAKPRAMVGLNSVDGFSMSDLYAVGLKGEIWHYDGNHWTQIESPTNVALLRVRCVAPKVVCACGAGGTILLGRGDQFRVAEHDTTSENLYGLESFGGKLYTASLKSLYVLEGDKLQPVDMQLGVGFTCGDLHTNDGVMWSFGARHLAYTGDGSSWTQAFYP